MTEIHHLNCLRIVNPVQDNVCGHCLLISEADRLVLIDTGIGLADVQNPEERIGQPMIDLVGYRFDEQLPAIKQIEKRGLDPAKVSDCIITHLDNDHIGGLADFPHATVHIGKEELENYNSGNPRYLKTPLMHNPYIKIYSTSAHRWLGFEARKIDIDTDAEIYLVPLFGHTSGHCGVAIKANEKWIFYIGDAYYLRVELEDSLHPVNQLAKMRADDDAQRLATLDKIRSLVYQHPEIDVFGYHDIQEFEWYTKRSGGKKAMV